MQLYIFLRVQCCILHVFFSFLSSMYLENCIVQVVKLLQEIILCYVQMFASPVHNLYYSTELVLRYYIEIITCKYHPANPDKLLPY